MKCPNCGKDNNKVINARSRKTTTDYYRRRQCLNCGYLFTTKEKYVTDELAKKYHKWYYGER